MVPSTEECFEFMKKYEMLDNIKAHSIMVERVAHLIAGGLREAGEDISLELTAAGALMHDIAKTPCLDTEADHAAVGRMICLENHLDEIADIVGEHIRLKRYEPDEVVSEKEIVYYADKRVNHDVVVSLQERLRYLLLRYGRGREHIIPLIRKNFDLSKEVEKKLFAKLLFGPEELARRINGGDGNRVMPIRKSMISG